MIRRLLAICILSLLVLSGFIGVTALTSTKTLLSASIETPIEEGRDRGSFRAEMGIRGSDEPLVCLNGTYHLRGRYIVVSGTATAGDRVGRFNGVFRGTSFFIKTPIRGGIRTVLGQCRFNDERHTFTGVWITRGIAARGWITGVMKPIE